MQHPKTRPLFHLLMGASLCLAFLVPISLPGLAKAQSFDQLSRDEQRKFDSLLDKAITAYDKERFDDALSLCAQAAEILPHPATVYLPARIADRRGECQQAVSLYQSLLDGTAAGDSEARWLSEYKGAIERNLETLGDCQFLLAVECAEADKGALLIANGALLGTCPDTIELSTSETQLVLMSRDGAQSSQRVRVKAGHTETVSFKPLPAPVAAAGAGVVKFECDSLSTPAVIFENGSALGSCPSALRLTAGKHTLEALDLDGKRAKLVIDVEADAPEQSLRFAPMYTLALSCDEPQLELSIAHPMLEEPLVGLCGDFAAQPPLLPQGTLSLTAKKERFRTLEQNFELGPQTQLHLQALEALPIRVYVRCADLDEPPVYVRIGTSSARCPFELELERGRHSVEARRDGYQPWKGEWQIDHGKDRFEVPAMQSRSFFSPGVITTGAAGVVLLTALVVDIVGYSALEEYKSAAAAGDVQKYNDYRDTVDATVWTTRILYGVGIAALGTGVALLVYEGISSDPSDFEEEQSWHLSPSLSEQQMGVTLHLSF